MSIRLTTPNIINPVVDPCGVSCRRVDPSCVLQRYHYNILVLYSSVTCVHDKLAQPTRAQHHLSRVRPILPKGFPLPADNGLNG